MPEVLACAHCSTRDHEATVHEATASGLLMCSRCGSLRDRAGRELVGPCTCTSTRTCDGCRVLDVTIVLESPEVSA